MGFLVGGMHAARPQPRNHRPAARVRDSAGSHASMPGGRWPRPAGVGVRQWNARSPVPAGGLAGDPMAMAPHRPGSWRRAAAMPCMAGRSTGNPFPSAFAGRMQWPCRGRTATPFRLFCNRLAILQPARPHHPLPAAGHGRRTSPLGRCDGRRPSEGFLGFPPRSRACAACAAWAPRCTDVVREWPGLARRAAATPPGFAVSRAGGFTYHRWRRWIVATVRIKWTDEVRHRSTVVMGRRGSRTARLGALRRSHGPHQVDG